MHPQHVFETLIARYARLADAEAALHELQDAAIPYPDIRMGAHAAHDCRHAVEGEQPTSRWSLTVMLDGQARERVDAILRRHAPRALSCIVSSPRARARLTPAAAASHSRSPPAPTARE